MPSMGEWFAELSTKGLESVKKDFETVGAGLKKLEAGALSLAATFKSAFVGMTGIVYGFATAGIAGSVQGERLGFQIRQLSLQVGSIFVPVVETAIEVVSALTNYLKGMSGETQGLILKWAGLAGGIAMVATGFGTIPGIMLAATSAFSILGDVSEKTINTIVEGLGKVTDIIIPLGQSIWSGLVDSFNAALPAIEAVASMLSDTFQAVLPPIMALLESFGGLFKQTFLLISEVVQAVAPVIRIAIGVVVTALESMAWILNKLIQALNWIVGKIKDTIKGVREEVAAVIADIGGNTPAAAGKEGAGAVQAAGNNANKEPNKKPRERTDLIPKSSSGFEAIGSAYTRIAQSVINQFDPAKAAKKAEDQREKGNGLLEKIANRIAGGKQPALAGV